MSKPEINLELHQVEKILELLLAFNQRLDQDYNALRLSAAHIPGSIYAEHIIAQKREKLVSDMRDIAFLQTRLKAIIKKKLSTWNA